MRNGLRSQLTMTIMTIVLITITLISILANIMINIEFEKYAKKQQQIRSEDIVTNLSRQYDSLNGQWNIDFVHGVGMYALYEGYVIKLYDLNGNIIWDAENHDMALCEQIMNEIEERMQNKRPELNGGFVLQEYDLQQNGQDVGKVAVTYYGPYFLNENDFEFLNTLNLVFVIIGCLSLLGSLIIGEYLAKRISRPIVKTANIAKQIAEGSYKIRFEGKIKTRELEELVTAVNHMAGSLERQENLRKQLTADVAHELRTPLTAVASHLEAMIEGVWEASPERLKSCYEEIGRITGLVNDMQNLAEVENDNLKLSKTTIDLLELAKTVSNNFESESAKKNISVEVDGESSFVLADKNRMSQVIMNLLSNAVKYTPENGYVNITVKDTTENGILEVKDNGIGIPEAELHFIFERFYRTDKSRNRKTGGAGIGLTIAKSIVSAHGGKIEVSSTVEQGSCFTVILPKGVDSKK